MKLDLFSSIDFVGEELLHPKFKFLKNEISVCGEKEVLENWTDGFIDRDGKIVKEFQTTFHSSLWEFFLFALLKKCGYTIDFSKDRPDFIITVPQQMYIEAVVSEIKKNGVGEENRSVDDILSMTRPILSNKEFSSVIDEAIVRNSNSFLFKSQKYLEKYKKLNWVDEKNPYVIAISSYDQINYGKEFYYSMMALLYGLYYNVEKKRFERKSTILKPGTDSPIPLGLFCDNSYEHVSAVIFSCTVTLGKLTALSISQGNFSMNGVLQIKLDSEEPLYKIKPISPESPEELEDGVFVFYNPYAKNPLCQDIFENTSVVQVRLRDKTKEQIYSNDMPLVSRISSPFLRGTALERIAEEIFTSYNI